MTKTKPEGLPMNRKDRRAARAQQRTGKSAPDEGERRAMPPGYYALIERMAGLIVEWFDAQPTRPDLRWHPWANDGVLVVAGLQGEPLKYLADSPDAFRLLAWLDEQTNREASLNQAAWALRLCRALPMPDGSYLGVETVSESPGYRATRLAMGRAYTDGDVQKIEESACGHCGEIVNGLSPEMKGAMAKPGCFTVCTTCGGINRFDDGMGLVRVTDDEVEAWPPENRDKFRDVQAVLRSARAQLELTGKMGGKAPVEA